ncbi:MAG: cell division ATP-binding protein FtsE [Bacillota bacterium]|nr:cell division ATP-binding protein FtsE [Bacillota bacterium]
MIELVNVCKEYPNGTKALANVNLKIDDGEFVFIVGPSGAGKSTLLKLLLKEEVPTSGDIYINKFNLRRLKNRKVPFLRRTMGVVFQDFRLIPEMTVFDNVAFAMRVVGAPMRIIKKRVPYILKLMNLQHKSQCYPSELSGGEQQRVALGRALVNNPKLIIADEPTGNVDPQMSREIMGLLDEINKRGTTVIVVTHERNLVNAMKKRVIFLAKGSLESDIAEGKYDEKQ